MKKVITFILTILITFLVCVLCFSLCIKDVIINTLSEGVIKKEISSIMVDSIEKLYDDVDYDVIEKIETNVGNSYEITTITEKYFDSVLESLIYDKDVSLPNTNEEIVKLINENEYVLNEAGIEVSPSDKERIANALTIDGKFDKVYQNVVKSVKNNLSNEEVMLVRVYDKITTNTFRWIALSIIVLMVLLIALIKKSYYRWLCNLGISFALSGIILAFVIPSLSESISLFLSNNLAGVSPEINFNPIINEGYLCFALCAISIIVYFIGNKLTMYNKSKYDY